MPESEGPGPMSTREKMTAAIAAFLDAHSTMTLATLGPDGRPLAASLFYASNEALRVYWVSGAQSRHSRALQQNPRVAMTVHNETWSWAEIAGVQLEGRVVVLPAGPTWQAAWERYLAKFPFAQEFQAEVSRSNFYELTPSWARLIDNGQGFGHKQEVELE